MCSRLLGNENENENHNGIYTAEKKRDSDPERTNKKRFFHFCTVTKGIEEKKFEK